MQTELPRSTPKAVDLASLGIHVFISRHAPGFRMAMDRWAFGKLCFVTRGRGRLVLEAGGAPLRTGEVVHLPAGLAHRFADEAVDPMTLRMVCFDSGGLDRVPGGRAAHEALSAALPPGEPFCLAETHRATRLYRVLDAMLFEQTERSPGWEALVWAGLIEILVLIARSCREFESRVDLNPRDRAFEATLDYIAENFVEPVRVPELATMAGVSYRRYTEMFRERTGLTVVAYLTALRLDYTMKRLQETGNIAAAASEAGFGDLAHFYRVFKRRFGCTPGASLVRERGGQPP